MSILTKAEKEERKGDVPHRYSITKDQRGGLVIDIPLGFTCNKHFQLIHSYVTSNNTLMCGKCITDSNYDPANIKPIPQVLKQMTTHLNSAKVKKEQCLSQMKMCRKDLEIHLEKQKDNCRTKIHNHFSQLISLVKATELKALAELEVQSERCIEKLSKVFEEIKQVKQNIRNDIKIIDNLLLSDDQSKVNCHDLILKIKSSKNQYHEVIDFPTEQIDLKFDDSAFVRVKEAIIDSFDFVPKETPEREQSKLIKQMFDVSVSWYCHRCSFKNLMKKSPIECSRCHTYKPLEIYPSLFNNRNSISDDEYNHLEQRRDYEKLRVNQEDNYRYQKVDHWYAIDAKWLQDWRLFIHNRPIASAHGCKKSEIAEVGVLDPGPISNSNLLNKYGELKPRLKIERDYRMVNEKVWRNLFDIYGGGPIFKRREADIYSEAMDADEEVKSIEKKIRKCKRIDKKM